MDKGKLVAVSDVHLDIWENQNPDTARAKRKAFLEFLAWVRDASGCEHFAIVGDLVDIPRPDHTPILPLYRDIALGLNSLLRSGINVHYVVGNHDVGMVGIDIAMTGPALRVMYPGAIIRCGEHCVWLEHGHLLDPWLWEYTRMKISALSAPTPREAMCHFLECGQDREQHNPPFASIHDELYFALQWRPDPAGFSRAEKRRGLQIMSQHLEETFTDVAQNGETLRLHEESLAGLQKAGVSIEQIQGDGEVPDEAIDLFMTIGGRYYSPLPWRRAAKNRLAELRRTHGPALRSIIMGHIHDADCYTWDSPAGPLTYANCGSWYDEHGSYVVVSADGIKAHDRRWDDPLP